MTPSELKYNVEQGKDHHFFTRSSMKFFGDTMGNYGCRDGGYITTYSGDKVEIWELWRKRPVKNGLCSSAYFAKDDFRRVFKPEED